MPKEEKRGPGRPQTIGAGTMISMRMDADTLKKIEALAKRWGCTRVDVVRRLVRERK